MARKPTKSAAKKSAAASSKQPTAKKTKPRGKPRRRRRALRWPDATDRYEQHLCALNQSPHTQRRKLQSLARLWTVLSKAGHTTLDSVSLQDLRQYQLGLFTGAHTPSGRPLDAASVASLTSVYRDFFGFLRREGLLPDDPTQELEQPKVPQKLVGDVLSMEEVKALIAARDVETPLGQRDRVVVELSPYDLSRGRIVYRYK